MERRAAINTFVKMIERMEDYILTGMGIPFTPFTVVNGEKLVPLLDRIRENLPVEVQNAQRVLERRDEIINDAQSKAGQMVQEAKKQSEFMLSESELLRAVHEEANRIRQQITLELEAMRKKAFEEAEAVRAQALEESRAIREGADQYAEAILGSLDKSLGEFQAVVRNGQRYLKKARMDNAQAAPPANRPGYPAHGAYGSSYGIPTEPAPGGEALHRERAPELLTPASAGQYAPEYQNQPTHH